MAPGSPVGTRRIIHYLVAAALASFVPAWPAAAAGLPSNGVYSDHIDWGVIADLSGPTAPQQSLWAAGFRDYIRMLDESGGVDGRTVNVLEEDDRFDPALDRIAFDKLTTQTPVLGLSGFSNAGGEVALMPRIRNGGVPIVGAYAIAGALTTPPTPRFYGGFCGLKQIVQVGLGFLKDRLNLSAPKVVAFHIDTSGGKEFASYVADAAAALGGSSAALPIKTTAADATPQVLDIARTRPDFIAVHGTANTLLMLMRSLDQYGLRIPVVGITTLGQPFVYQSMTPAVGKDFYFVSCFTPGSAEQSPAVKQMVDYASKLGHAGMTDDINYVGGWVIGQLVAAAIHAAGPDLSRDGLATLLNSGFALDTHGLSAPFSFTPDDHRGLLEMRPYGFDYDTKRFTAVGSYADYARYVR